MGAEKFYVLCNDYKNQCNLQTCFAEEPAPENVNFLKIRKVAILHFQ